MKKRHIRLLRHVPYLAYLAYICKRAEAPVLVWRSIVLSLVEATVLALVFAVVEVGYTSTCICTNPICETVRAEIDHLHLAPVHIIMLITYVLVSFTPYCMYRWLTGRGEPRLLLTGLATLSYCYLVEDILWHIIAWMARVQQFPTFCKWARWPLYQLPFPWWYIPTTITAVGVIWLTWRWLQESKKANTKDIEFKTKVAQILKQKQTKNQNNN